MAIGSVVIMPILWIQKKIVGREGNLRPLTIDAVESATCFFMSIALLGGLVLNYVFGISWADYVGYSNHLGFCESGDQGIVRRNETSLTAHFSGKPTEVKVRIIDKLPEQERSYCDI